MFREVCAALFVSSVAAACVETASVAEAAEEWPEGGGVAEAPPAAWVELESGCTPDAAAQPLSAARRAELPPVARDHRTADELFAGIAERVPGGFGGLFYDVGGRLTILLVDPEQEEQATRALARLLAEIGLDRIVPDLRHAVVRQGRWDFLQLFDWYRFLNGHVWRVEGVKTSSIADARNRLEFGVTDEEARDRVTVLLDSLGVPCYLVALALSAP